MIKLKPLLINLLIPLGLGGISAFLIRDSVKLYGALEQPALSPPGWVFPLVWTALYFLMGVAAYLVWMRDSTGRTGALTLYGLQLLVNVVWPILFFNLQDYRLAFFWIVALWALVLLTVIRFFGERKAAGWLMAPYLLWVSFAAYLNAGVWLLNS